METRDTGWKGSGRQRTWRLESTTPPGPLRSPRSTWVQRKDAGCAVRRLSPAPSPSQFFLQYSRGEADEHHHWPSGSAVSKCTRARETADRMLTPYGLVKTRHRVKAAEKAGRQCANLALVQLPARCARDGRCIKHNFHQSRVCAVQRSRRRTELHLKRKNDCAKPETIFTLLIWTGCCRPDRDIIDSRHEAPLPWRHRVPPSCRASIRRSS